VARAGPAPHLRRPRGQRAKLGLHLARDVVQQVLVVLVVQQLLAAHLRARAHQGSGGARLTLTPALGVE